MAYTMCHFCGVKFVQSDDTEHICGWAKIRDRIITFESNISIYITYIITGIRIVVIFVQTVAMSNVNFQAFEYK